MKAAVIGWPIEHSRSPEIFKTIAPLVDYQKIAVEPKDLKSFVQTVHFDGLNITLPHKINMATLCHELSSEAQEIGAVNCVKFVNNKIIGFNTDALACQELLAPHRISSALIFGAGGAAKAAEFSLKKLGVREIHIISHRDDLWLDRHQISNSYDLIINATPLGMKHLDYQSLKIQAAPKIVMDFVYLKETPTPFLKEYPTSIHITGEELLVAQAKKSYEIWSQS